MKVIQKHHIANSGNTPLQLAPDANPIGAGLDNGQIMLYVEAPAWASGYVYWDIQIVREGESFADGMKALGTVDDPNMPAHVGYKLFIVGRISG